MLEFTPIAQWYDNLATPLIIAGPCSAESEQQVLQTATALAKSQQVSVFRAGVWKPRTRPGGFEGAGVEALKWLQRVKHETGLRLSTEVALPEHVRMATNHGVDMVWVGARTAANPFSIDQLAAELALANIPVLVKNPVTPDLELWIGAIERLQRAGVRKIAAVHRGFYPYAQTHLRNIPKWEVAIDLKSRLPQLPIIGDPSHIAGRAELVPELAQHALNLSFDGLMIEVHPSPSTALSDARQQLSPEAFASMLNLLRFPTPSSTDSNYISLIEQARSSIDSIDIQILELLSNRMRLIEQIGRCKQRNNVTVVQQQRWERIRESRTELGIKLGLREEYITSLLELVHKESIKRQAEIIKGDKSE